MTPSSLKSADEPQRVAFFDVDETLIVEKSMFAFLRFWLARTSGDGAAYRACSDRLGTMARRGDDRAAINRAYYRLYAGEVLAELLGAGEAWYAKLCDQPKPFVAASLAALTRHRAAGDAVVLVSGSFHPCLDPIGAHMSAHSVLCTEPVVDDDGRLTGDVLRPMIGATKADAVAATMSALRARPEHCYAYADHASDLDMLSMVGHKVVVGPDPILRFHARHAGWSVLPVSHTRAPAKALRVRTPPAPPCATDRSQNRA